MKRNILMLILAALPFALFAQDEDSGFRNGIRAKIGMGNVCGEGSSGSFSYGLDWVAEYSFSPNLFLQSGLGFESIRHNEEYVSGSRYNVVYVSERLGAFYAQLPIHVGYRMELTETMSLFAQAGPTLGIGLFGSSSNIAGSYFDRFNRFDLGIGGRIGAEFGFFRICVGTDYGVIDASDGDGRHNFTFNVGLSYMF